MRFVRDVACVPLSVAFALVVGVATATVASGGSSAGSGAPGPAASGSSAVRPQLSGSARVLDGDTIEISARDGTLVRVRLEGIDAPEGGQRCNRRLFGEWDCGQAATHALRLLTDGRTVVCEDHGLDKYNRTLGICFVDGRDINAAMVRAGLAWAFVRYSTAYVAEEAHARAARAGVWQAPTMAPWDWRAQVKAGSAAAAQPSGPAPGAAPQPVPVRPDTLAGTGADMAPGCTIKGNVTRNGRIYHTVDSPWYERIRMNLGLGRRWFCSETEAVRAGWRPALAGRSE